MDDLVPIVRRAAQRAAFEWPGVMSPDDVAQEVWVRILESPATQRKMVGPATHACRMAYTMARQVLARESSSNATFNGSIAFSVDEVKQSLETVCLRGDLRFALQAALNELAETQPTYYAALTRRYSDGQAPETDADRKRLDRAVCKLTEAANRVHRTDRYDPTPGGTLGDGPGRRVRPYAPRADEET